MYTAQLLSKEYSGALTKAKALENSQKNIETELMAERKSVVDLKLRIEKSSLTIDRVEKDKVSAIGSFPSVISSFLTMKYGASIFAWLNFSLKVSMLYIFILVVVIVIAGLSSAASQVQ